MTNNFLAGIIILLERTKQTSITKNKIMSHQWTAPIDKLMIWKTNSWTRYESRSTRLSLRIHYDQLLITSDCKVVESFNMNNKIKGVYKDDVLILIISITGQEIKKFKFQLKADPPLYFQELGKHFPVIHHSGAHSSNSLQMKYRNIDEVLKHALENKELITATTLPSEYRNFIKLCLLDPSFPQVVAETAKLLQEDIYK